MTLELKLKRRSPAETKDSLGAHSIVGCEECNAVLGKEWPLWGLHLTAALTYHAAHWLIAEMRAIPVMTDEDRVFGRRLVVVEDRQP